MKLLADIGNSTIQVALWKKQSLYKILQIPANDYKKINSLLLKYKKYKIDSAFFSCVANDEIARIFKKYVKQLFECPIRRIKSSRKYFQIKNAYDSYKKFGDDRWCLIVGSYLKYKRPLLLVDCGTLTTIDIVNKSGRHLGGYILAGFDCYKNSFDKINNLKNLKFNKKQKKKHVYFPKNTHDGIFHGYRLMICSTIQKIFNDFRTQYNVQPKLVICGGNSKEILNLIKIKHEHELHMVLQAVGLISDKI